jgi:histidine triad (HIT) family protein
MENCIFCKIGKNEIPSNKVLENNEFIAFHDINPKAPVHILVIPKQHFESFQVSPNSIMGSMSNFIQDVAKKVGIDKSGYRIISNIGENGGQEVPHLHVHLLGGSKLKWDNFSDSDPKKNL